MESDVDIPRLFNMGDLVTPMVIRAAATLRLPDHVHDGIDTVPELAKRVDCVSRVLSKIVDHLVSLGIFARTDSGRIEIAPFGTPLLSTWDGGSFRSSYDLDAVAGREEMSITALLHTVRTGQTAYEGLYGETFWTDVNSRSGTDQGIAELAPVNPGFNAELVIDCYDWSRWSHVIDVGGNNGALLGALLHAHPHLSGTVLDLEKFAQLAHPTLRYWEASNRATVTGGNFFEALPDHGDVYLLSAILADWTDEDAVAILRRCGHAATPKGRVLLAEIHMTEHEGLEPPLSTALPVRWEASITHPDRTVDDLCALADQAEMDVVWKGPATGVRSVLELQPRTRSVLA